MGCQSLAGREGRWGLAGVGASLAAPGVLLSPRLDASARGMLVGWGWGCWSPWQDDPLQRCRQGRGRWDTQGGCGRAAVCTESGGGGLRAEATLRRECAGCQGHTGREAWAGAQSCVVQVWGWHRGGVEGQCDVHGGAML